MHSSNKRAAMEQEIQDIGRRAKQAALELAALSGAQKQEALQKMKQKLLESKEALMKANAADVAAAKEAGLTAPMIKRLTITDKVFDTMCKRLVQVADLLPDPVGRVLEGSHTRPTGLVVQKVSVPLGVVALIYESRPNVTTDAASVCLKSGNAVILRGGSESVATNTVLAAAMMQALEEAGLPKDAIQLIKHKGHESVDALLKMHDYIDVIIPRGGKGLIQKISQGTNIPVIKHYDGVCHLYLAEDAPLEWARDVAVNSKCQSIEVCNALETLLVDAKLATNTTITGGDAVLMNVLCAFTERGIEIRGCPRIVSFVKDCGLDDDTTIVPATEEDWSTEYLAPILSIKVVDGLLEAIQHINRYGSGHTDGIITNNLSAARQFTSAVDSASVLVNCSTRLSGGGDYGMGAVVGISTDKLHARGPVGASELTSYKWVAQGQGHLRN